MNMQKRKSFKLLLIALALTAGIYGCRTPRTVPEVPPLSNASKILHEVHANHADYQWLSTRFSGTVLFENKTHSIAGSMRMKKDSAIYVSIAPILGIEIARAIITPDSVKLVNRLESAYYIGGLRILSEMFNADVDFYMLQALLSGNDFPHFRTDQFVLGEDERLMTLQATSRTRKNGRGTPIRQVISVDPSNMRIRTNTLEQVSTRQALRADYRKYDRIDGRLIPTDLVLMFADEENNTSRMEMIFSRTTLDVPQNMQFSVPARYTPIRLTD
jgi:hypothetical protein